MDKRYYMPGCQNSDLCKTMNEGVKVGAMFNRSEICYKRSKICEIDSTLFLYIYIKHPFWFFSILIDYERKEKLIKHWECKGIKHFYKWYFVSYFTCFTVYFHNFIISGENSTINNTSMRTRGIRFKTGHQYHLCS